MNNVSYEEFRADMLQGERQEDAAAAAMAAAMATAATATAAATTVKARFVNKPDADIFASGCDWLVNPVNCVGISGVLAGAFAKRYPMMEAVYWHGCKWSLVHLGAPQPYYAPNNREPNVVLFPTMYRPGSASNLRDITAGLEALRAKAAAWGLTSIAFPGLGCGVGGLRWTDVEAEIRRILAPLDLDVELYGPESAALPAE